MIANGHTYLIRNHSTPKILALWLRVPPLVNSSYMSVFFSLQPTKRTVSRLPRVMSTLEDRLSKKSNIVLPKSFKSESGPKESEQKAPSTQQIANMIAEAPTR